MPKYTKEFKIQLMLEYLSGETGGCEKVAKKYNIPGGTSKNWIEKYKSGGFGNSPKKLKNNKSTSESKLSVIQYGQVKNTPFRETAEHFNLVNKSIIYRWEKTYQERGLSGLKDNRGKSSKDMTKLSRKSKPSTPISESEREELIRPREENKFLKMEIIYEKKLRALLLEEEVEARRRQR